MYLIDTDVLIWVLRGNESYVSLLENLKEKGTLSLTTVTVAEIYKNIFPAEIVRTERLLDEFQIWDITMPIAKSAGLYWQQYVRHMKSLSLIDCFIAATASINKLTVVSLNRKHYPMSDIKLLDL